MSADVFISGLLLNTDGDLVYLPPESSEMTDDMLVAVTFLESSMEEYSQIKAGNDPYGVGDMVDP